MTTRMHDFVRHIATGDRSSRSELQYRRFLLRYMACNMSRKQQKSRPHLDPELMDLTPVIRIGHVYATFGFCAATNGLIC